MVQDMGLTPQIADQLQSQQQQMGQMGPGSAEEQMRMMQYAQQQAQQPPMQMPPMQMQPQAPPAPPLQPQSVPPGYDTASETPSESTASTVSEIEADLEKVGLNIAPKSTIDNVMDCLKDPIIVIVLFIVFSLTPVGDMIKKLLPLVITSNNYYLIGIKALLVGGLFLGSKLVIA
jgi:hypothetical protein